MCAMQSRALLSVSMCAQQTWPGWKGFCKVPVCTALSLLCGDWTYTAWSPFLFFPSLRMQILRCVLRISKVISPLRGSGFLWFPEEVYVKPVMSVKDECWPICFQVKQMKGFTVCLPRACARRIIETFCHLLAVVRYVTLWYWGL